MSNPEAPEPVKFEHVEASTPELKHAPPLTLKEWNQFRYEKAGEFYDYLLELPDNQLMTHKQFFEALPSTLECNRNRLRRIGIDGDGGKWFCGEYMDVEFSPDCTIISLGSFGDFSFEVSIDEYVGRKCKVDQYLTTSTRKTDVDLHP